MSFGGKSFKKDQMKKELELLAKISHDEFSTLPPGEKAVIRERSSKHKLYERTKVKKKKAKDDGMLDYNSYIPPPSPSIDLNPEMRASVDLCDMDRPDSIPVSYTGVQGSATTRVASIKSNVDLNVVMQGKGIVTDNYSMCSQVTGVNVVVI
jgi:hypothetical protein